MSESGDFRDLCWHGEAQLAALARRLQAALAEWAKAWGLSAAEVRCHNAWEAAAAVPAWSALAADPAGAAQVWWTGEAAGIGQALFGSTGVPPCTAPAPVAQGVTSDALDALRAAMLGAMGWQGTSDASSPPPSDAKAWSGAVLAECRVQGVQALELKLHLRQSAWPRASTQSKPAAQGGLASLSAQLADQPVTVRAWIDDVTLSLGELMGLQLGDVLVTPQRLDAPLAIRAAQDAQGAAPLFSGWLAQRSGHMAVTLVPVGNRVERQ